MKSTFLGKESTSPVKDIYNIYIIYIVIYKFNKKFVLF